MVINKQIFNQRTDALLLLQLNNYEPIETVFIVITVNVIIVSKFIHCNVYI